jgi:hypothetical protein
MAADRFEGAAAIRLSGTFGFNPEDGEARTPSGGFGYQSRPDAARTDADPPNRSVFVRVTNRLKVGQPQALGLVVGVADVVAHVGHFSTKFTFPAHDLVFLSSSNASRYKKRTKYVLGIRFREYEKHLSII